MAYSGVLSDRMIRRPDFHPLWILCGQLWTPCRRVLTWNSTAHLRYFCSNAAKPEWSSSFTKESPHFIPYLFKMTLLICLISHITPHNREFGFLLFHSSSPQLFTPQLQTSIPVVLMVPLQLPFWLDILKLIPLNHSSSIPYPLHHFCWFVGEISSMTSGHWRHLGMSSLRQI